jgi:hypothetical protein
MADKKRRALAKERRARDRARAKRRRVWLLAAAGAVALAAVATIPVLIRARPGRSVESQGRAHIPVGTSGAVVYNTDPPTSGPHYDPSAAPGIYDAPIPDGYLIHSLEHGYVILSHSLESLPDDEAERTLAELIRIAEEETLWKLIVIPRPGMEHRFALTAWQRIDTFDELDERRIRRFISAWRDRGPEHTAN